MKIINPEKCVAFFDFDNTIVTYDVFDSIGLLQIYFHRKIHILRIHFLSPCIVPASFSF